MIIVKIAGGLGNQMFQYATAKNIAEKLGSKLYIDIGYYEKYNDRCFKIKEIFGIEDEVIKNKDIPFIFRVCKNKYINFMLRKTKINIESYILQNGFDLDNRLLEPRYTKKMYIDGYWHNEKYFLCGKEEMRKIFDLQKTIGGKAKTYVQEIKLKNSVSVHIRRGDYNNKKNSELYGTCSIEYYNVAIDEIAKEIESPKFYFFSDDIEWVQQNLNVKYECTFIDQKFEDYEELYMMSQCKHNIIANSSFSWWGAWLNDNANKIVIAPKKWTKKLNTTEQTIPSEWRKI